MDFSVQFLDPKRFNYWLRLGHFWVCIKLHFRGRPKNCLSLKEKHRLRYIGKHNGTVEKCLLERLFLEIFEMAAMPFPCNGHE